MNLKGGKILYYFWKLSYNILKFIPERFIRSANRFLVKKFFTKDMAIKANLELTDVEKLSENIKFQVTAETYKANDLYSHAITLKKYAATNVPIKAIMEHGVCFADTHRNENDLGHAYDTILTFGPHRKNILEKYTDKKVIPMGPFIAYAKPLLSEKKFVAEKQKIGKNLLLFPCHSVIEVDTSYDFGKFINQALKIKQDLGLDSIRACIYWKDVLIGTHKEYQKYGIECVTAGHFYDPSFLSRLKSIIELSDVVVTNDLITSIGYAFYLNKAVMNVPSELQLRVSSFVSSKRAQKELQISRDFYNQLADLQEEYHSLFSEYQITPKKEQYDFINKYWGLDCVKSPEEVKELLLRL